MAEPVRDNRLTWGIVAVAVVLLGALYWIWSVGNTLTGIDQRGQQLQARVDTLAALEQKQADLEAKFTALEPPNLEPIQAKVAELEARLTEVATATAVATLEKRQSDLEAKIAALDLQPLQQQVDALKSGLTALDTRVTSISVPNLDELTARVAAVEAEIASLKTGPDQTALQTEVSELKASLQALQTQVGDVTPMQITGLTARLDALSKQVTDLGTPQPTTPGVELAALDARVGNLETKVAAIDLAPVNARVDTVAADLATVAADVETVKTTANAAATTEQVAIIETRVADLGTQLSTSSTGFESIRSETAALTTRIGELNTALESKAESAQVTTLSDQLAALQKQVDDLPDSTDTTTFQTSVDTLRTDLNALAAKVAALPSTDEITKMQSDIEQIRNNPPPVPKREVWESIFFDPSSTSVNDDQKAKLAAVFERLKSSGSSLDLIGFTDSQGPAELNRSLSQRRAAAVRAALLEAGVDPAAVTSVTGLGEDGPPIAGDDDTDEARNRVVLIYGR